jgi:hypothetical protein
MLEQNNLTYVIFDASELDTINFNQVEQTSAETCRLSIDKTKTLVKWSGAVPSSVEPLATKGLYLSQDEILEIMSTPEWTEPTPT